MERAEHPKEILNATDLGVVACRRCMQVWPQEAKVCDRCGSNLVQRDTASLQRVWALWLMGLMCYIPANLFPMLQTRTLFSSQGSTILGGAIELFQHGSYGVAIIILFASTMIPIAKFIAIAFLSISVLRPTSVSKSHRQFLYEIVEYIGRWSMVDIFVVAILSSLVQLNALAAITPGLASVFFALSVIFTMLSAKAFDSRMIWDAQQQGKGKSRND